MNAVTLPTDKQLLLLSSVIDAARVGLVVLDADQRVVLWNRWMEQHARRPAADMVGRRLTELFPELEGGRLHLAVRGSLEHNLSSLISQTLNKAPFPLYPLHADTGGEAQRLDQAVQVMPLRFGDEARHCLIQVSDVSMAVARERQLREQALELQSQTLLDGLTGIANRRRFDAHLDDEFRRAKRNGTPISLVMLDVDCFKAYNDNYGHQKGDQCLIQIAGALTQVLCRPCDLLARYGGEEFMAILPDTNSDGAVRIAESMRRQIEALEIEHAYSGVSRHVTISLGVITMIPQPNATTAHLIGGADRALYKAKHTGRNRVAVYGASSLPD